MRNAVLGLVLIVIAGAAWFAITSTGDRRPVDDPAEAESAAAFSVPLPAVSSEEGGPQNEVGSIPAVDVDANLDEQETPSSTAGSEAFSIRMQRSIEQFKSEAVDPDWAPEMGRLLRNETEAYLSSHPELRERYSVASVDCRTSACELEFHDYSPNPNPAPVDLSNMLRTLYVDNWFEEFEDDWFGVSTTDNGIFENRQYFQRRSTEIDLESLQILRIPIVAPPEPSGE